MEQRTLLAVALSIAVLVIFQIFFAPPPPEKGLDLNATNDTLPKAELSAPKEGSDQAKAVTPPAEARPSKPESGATARQGREARVVEVETPLFKARFSEEGGTLLSFTLKGYRVSLEKDAPLVELLSHKAGEPLPLSLSLGQRDLSHILFTADAEQLLLSTPESKAVLTFRGLLSDGTEVIKRFRFSGETYWMEMEIAVKGPSATAPTIHLYNHPLGHGSRYIFAGPSYYTGKDLEEVKLSKGEGKAYEGPLSWVGYGDNYFTTTLIPLKPTGPMKVSIQDMVAEKLTAVALTPKNLSAKEVKLGLYFGPKEIDLLKRLDHDLSEAINFGWFDVIAKPILYALKFLYRFIHNYGWAIIVITVLIKLAFWPLAHKSAQSMKTMQRLQPKLQKLKEKYGDDKERLNRELMQLYKTYKVNPMSGCLPMLLQIPVFFALYKVLLQAIELRHAPFMLWINDLSAPDRLTIPGVDIPYLHGIPVLTLLMGVSMYFQQKMSPSSLDPNQARMMQILPIVFTFMFINFPSGLVLYWLVNNVLSIVQQYYVNKFTD